MHTHAHTHKPCRNMCIFLLTLILTHSTAHSSCTNNIGTEHAARRPLTLYMFTNKFNLFPSHKPNIYSSFRYGPKRWGGISALSFSFHSLLYLFLANCWFLKVCFCTYLHSIEKLLFLFSKKKQWLWHFMNIYSKSYLAKVLVMVTWMSVLSIHLFWIAGK